MKNKIIDSIGKIDDDMIESVDVLRRSPKKRSRPTRRRWIAMAAILILTAAVVLVGFATNYHITDESLNALGNEVITSVTGESVSLKQKDSDEIENFPDTYKYVSENYIYYVDVNEEYIRGIMPAHDFFTDNGNILQPQEVKEIESQLFEKVLGSYVTGEIETDFSGDGESGYISTITEKEDNIETGLKASIAADQNGNIVAASFYKGDSESALDFLTRPGITFDEGYEIAVKEIHEFDQRHDEIDYIGSDQTVHRQGLTQYYEYTFNYYEDNIGYMYRIKINVLTGGVVEIEYSI